MRFDILSNRSAAEQAIRDDLLKKKYKIKGEQAKAATMRAQAAGVTAVSGAKTEERRFGPGGLAGEELARRYPMGIPAKAAETARISATGYAGAATRGAETAAGRLELEREESLLAREYLFGEEGGDDISAIKRMATEEEGVARPGGQICPEGFVWDGRNCVPSM
jgi:hypothetical protein